MGKVVNNVKYMTISQVILAIIVLIFSNIFIGMLGIWLGLMKDQTWLIVRYIPAMLIVILYLFLNKRYLFKNKREDMPKMFFLELKFYYVIISLFLLLISYIVFYPYFKILNLGNILISFSGDIGSGQNIAVYGTDLYWKNTYVVFLVTVIIAPILEEIVFRGYIQTGLDRRYGAFVAIVSTSVVYIFIYLSMSHLFSAFYASLIFSIIFAISKNSLLTVICVHFVNNLVAYAIGRYVDDIGQVMEVIRDYLKEEQIWNMVYSLSVLSLVLFVFLAFKKIKSNKIELYF